mgnify:FL=1
MVETNDRRLPVGIQSFEKIRKGGYLYVDSNQQPIFCCQIIYHIIHFFYRKNKDLSPITGQVSTIKLIHPFYPKLTPGNTRGLSGR